MVGQPNVASNLRSDTQPRKEVTMPRTSNRGRTFPPEVLSPDEARRLLGACSRGATGARNRGLVVLLYRAGLRVGVHISALVITGSGRSCSRGALPARGPQRRWPCGR